jgi:hypothetical protein
MDFCSWPGAAGPERATVCKTDGGEPATLSLLLHERAAIPGGL